MEGRFPQGLLYELSNCDDRSREAAFIQWYADIHLPDMVGSGFLESPILFQSVQVPHDSGEAKYMATYEIEQDDLSAVAGKVNGLMSDLAGGRRMHPTLDPISCNSYRRIESSFWTRSYGRKVTGLLVVEARCTDDTREGEFNDWYNDVHLPDVLATGLFHTTYRYRALSPGTGEGKYMAIYETDIPDPDAAVNELMSTFRPLWREKGRAIDIIQNTRRGIYKRLYPAV